MATRPLPQPALAAPASAQPPPAGGTGRERWESSGRGLGFRGCRKICLVAIRKETQI